MTLLRELFLEIRQQQPGLRNRGLLRRDIRLGNLPLLLLLSQQLQNLGLQTKDATGRRDLSPNPTFLARPARFAVS